MKMYFYVKWPITFTNLISRETLFSKLLPKFTCENSQSNIQFTCENANFTRDI